MAQLVFQPNDAVEDEDYARDKYVACQPFLRLAPEGQLQSGFDTDDDRQKEIEAAFRLFSENLRPFDALIDRGLRMVGVINQTVMSPCSYTFRFIGNDGGEIFHLVR